MDPVILESTSKHGIFDEDMIHAYQHPIRVLRLDDLTMLIGPGQSTRLLEIGVSTGEGVEFIVHAILARQKFLR